MRRFLRTTLGIAAIVLLALVGIIVADSYLLGQGCDTELCCESCSPLAVVRVIDGDTFVSPEGPVRLYGIDAPEVGERCASQATQRMRALAGDEVRVERGPRASDRYGRSLYYIYTEGGDSIDEILVREGLAVAWTADGQHLQYLMSLADRARNEGVGCLW